MQVSVMLKSSACVCVCVCVRAVVEVACFCVQYTSNTHMCARVRKCATARVLASVICPACRCLDVCVYTLMSVRVCVYVKNDETKVCESMKRIYVYG